MASKPKSPPERETFIVAGMAIGPAGARLAVFGVEARSHDEAVGIATRCNRRHFRPEVFTGHQVDVQPLAALVKPVTADSVEALVREFKEAV